MKLNIKRLSKIREDAIEESGKVTNLLWVIAYLNLAFAASALKVLIEEIYVNEKRK